MGMNLLRRANLQPDHLAILAGAFHPPTRAHLGIARAALAVADEVLLVLPRRFPHKQYESAGFEQRLQLLLDVTADEPRFSVAASDGGLFIEIARECRDAYGPRPELWFVCGSDAAERIATWDYGRPDAFARMLDEFGLLVADRCVPYEPPSSMRSRIRCLRVPEDYSEVSATEVRERIAQGRPWERLVPPAIVESIRAIYAGSAS
ncbi:MAG: nicotinate-nicotinamide nucleotide adenylyltransferase [Bryobacteraceae bacterium]|nr:nicotinate-nicotinamide nucleotide adenylyltransferase [Bryobacteraceae bacterium]